MFSMILQAQKEKKYIIQGSILFGLFLVLYFVLDYLNLSYTEMISNYGAYLVVVNILLNIVMAFISAFMWNISTAMVRLNGKEGKSSLVPGLAYLFGMLTYGCTPCVIAFFSVIGLTFSVAVLPLAGLPYKLIALALLIIGFFWLKYEANHVRCKVKINPNDDEKTS